MRQTATREQRTLSEASQEQQLQLSLLASRRIALTQFREAMHAHIMESIYQVLLTLCDHRNPASSLIREKMQKAFRLDSLTPMTD